MELDSNNHSVFLLYYHLVLVIKYRRNVFDDDILDYAKDMFVRLFENYNITLVEWSHDVDNVSISEKLAQKYLHKDMQASNKGVSICNSYFIRILSKTKALYS
ncbi:Transposase IS200 like [Bacillus sp. ok061]|uniref:transposase n=1 Tax=Bacillus sp. ok061 TaxID=1761766 RepID=UPI00089E8A4E|nr:transposase [Bacillus sp. ok061]SEG86632.1 Transposase IS200 like [Bacillus sp. ok061]